MVSSVRYVSVSFTALFLLWSSLGKGEVIFTENFDDQPDYFPTKYTDRINTLYKPRGDVVPEGWDAVSGRIITGTENTDSIEISGDNLDAVRGREGKSLVLRRHTNLSRWHGDGQLAKNFQPGYQEIYVRFWIKFQPGWLQQGMSKVFRIGSYAPGAVGSAYWSTLGMGALWQYVHTAKYGVRNNLSLRALPGNIFSNPDIGDPPANYSRSKVVNGNYSSMPYDLNNDGIVDNYPNLVNQLSGDIMPVEKNYVIDQDVLFGTEWHKIEFYIKVNSAPGEQDGVLAQWFDDGLIFLNKTIPWIQNDGDPNLKFTAVKFGGNHHTKSFHEYHKSVDRVEWYAIDDIMIRSDLPENLALSPAISPNAPTNIKVE